VSSGSPSPREVVLQGCGFFRVVGGRIRLQRGDRDRATWFGQLGLPV
jgi:hypothetical protein